LIVVRKRWKIEEFLCCAAGVVWIARSSDSVDCRACGRLREKGVKVAKIFLDFAELSRVDILRGVVDGESKLRFPLFQLGFEDLTCAWNSVALVVKEALDAQGHFNVAAAIETLAGAALVRFELGKLALPESQDVGWDIAEPGDFSDAKVELIRNVRSGGGGSFTDWLMLRHARNSDGAVPAAVACGPASGKYRPPNSVWLQFFLWVRDGPGFRSGCLSVEDFGKTE
jgi:hypothetical protein